MNQNYVSTITSMLPVDVKDKPGYPLQVAQLQLLQAQVVLLQDILQKLTETSRAFRGIPEVPYIPKEQTMAKKAAPAKGGKVKKCPNCGKSYSGEKCPHCAGGKGKPVAPKQKGGWRDSDATAY